MKRNKETLNIKQFDKLSWKEKYSKTYGLGLAYLEVPFILLIVKLIEVILGIGPFNYVFIAMFALVFVPLQYMIKHDKETIHVEVK